MEIIINIDDQRLLDGLTLVAVEAGLEIDLYVQRVMEDACESYAQQHVDTLDTLKAKLLEERAKSAQLRAELESVRATRT